MLFGVRQSGCVAFTATLVCLLSSVALGEQTERDEPSFEARFQLGAPLAPTFTRPEIHQRLSAMYPFVFLMNSSTLAELPVPEGRPTNHIAFAQPKGPAKVLKELLNTPINELLVSRAEAGPDQPKPGVPEESAPTPNVAVAAVSENAPVPPRAAEPLSERPPAERLATLPAAAPSPSVEQQLRPSPEPGALSSELIASAPPTPDPTEAPPPSEQTASTRAPSSEAAQHGEHSAALASPRGKNPQHADTTGAVKGGLKIGRGYAAWYQHPGRTASGEVFNPDHLTAAHHTLPFGTHVRVVEERSRRSVIVRINDRIPAKAKIAIDLSRASARAIGVSGRARVALYAVDPGATTAAAAAEVRKSKQAAKKETGRDFAQGPRRVRFVSAAPRKRTKAALSAGASPQMPRTGPQAQRTTVDTTSSEPLVTGSLARSDSSAVVKNPSRPPHQQIEGAGNESNAIGP